MSALSCQAVLATHGPTLLIDAASARLQVGWAAPDTPPQWLDQEVEAGTGLYTLLAAGNFDPNAAAAFVYCEGPGSMLGIRTIAAALRTWTALAPRPIYHYRSLELAAAALAQPGSTVISDARRQSWHTLSLDDNGQPGPIQRHPTADLPPGPLFTLQGFRTWTALPDPPPATLPYDAAWLTDTLADAPLLTRAEDPDAFQPERPTYAKWEPRVHQPPAP